MALAIGDCLGPYEIQAAIGSGAMGDVYRAKDTRLNRIVAIKVCKEEFSARFEREARAVAALNHRQICARTGDGPLLMAVTRPFAGADRRDGQDGGVSAMPPRAV